MPAIVFRVTDLPAPLSPTSAVTLPGNATRSTLLSARTAPKLLDRPRNSRSGACPGSRLSCPTASPAAWTVPNGSLLLMKPPPNRSPGRTCLMANAAWPNGLATCLRCLRCLVDVELLAGGGDAVADSRSALEAIRYDRRLHVGGGHPHWGLEHVRDVDYFVVVRLGAVVDHVATDQAPGESHAGPQVEGGNHGGLGLQVDGLVDRTALVASEDVLHTLHGAVLTSSREGEGLDAVFLQGGDDGVVQAVIGDDGSVDVGVRH